MSNMHLACLEGASQAARTGAALDWRRREQAERVDGSARAASFKTSTRPTGVVPPTPV